MKHAAGWNDPGSVVPISSLLAIVVAYDQHKVPLIGLVLLHFLFAKDHNQL